MKGSLVKQAIKLARKTQEDVAISLGITREHLVRLLQTEVPEQYVILMRKQGIEIEKVTNSDNYHNQINDPGGNYKITHKTIPLIPVDAMAGYGTGEIEFMNADRYLVPEFQNVTT